jgi:hypothetical protein
MEVGMPLDLRQSDGEDDADEDLLFGDGVPRGALLLLRGHHVAALACVARSCAHPDAAAPARTIAAEVCKRLRDRQGVGIARALVRLDIAGEAFGQRLSKIASDLRAAAERIGSDALGRLVDDGAAKRLCRDPAAWLGTGTLAAAEVENLAAHVASGAEVFGGLGDGHSFLRMPILKSGIDTATEPALEVEVTSVPPRRVDRFAARVRLRTDPDTMIGTEQTLRLVRQHSLMICVAVDDRTAQLDEATSTLRLDLEA